MQECNQRNSNGNREGYWEVYHPNGNLNYKGFYKDGRWNGYWEYYSNGKLTFKEYYARM